MRSDKEGEFRGHWRRARQHSQISNCSNPSQNVNADNRVLTLRHFSVKLEGVGFSAGSSKIYRWLQNMGARVEPRRATPKLPCSHQKDRVNVYLDLASSDRRTYNTCINIIYVNEAWFYVIHDREKVRMLPGKERVGSIQA